MAIAGNQPSLKACLGFVLVGCIAGAAEAPPAPHRLTQVAVIDALMVGRYDGVMSVAELLRHGDLGVGTLDHLDGELVVLDGTAYQIRGDGRVVAVDPDRRSTPFAVVTPFAPDQTPACPPAASLAELDAHLDELLPQKNNFAAIRIDGRFAALTMRSVPRQEPPYRPLDEVAQGQSIWTRTDQVGTLVGIRCPAWVGGLNVPGYHWHFLAEDRRSGGHVLDCKVATGRVQAQVCQDWVIKLEGTPGFNQADLSQDRSRAVHRVESSRGAGSR